MKSTRKSLLLSALSLILCVAMLAGSTLAWFTDSVSSGKNQIVAGNLDIGLQYKNATQTAYADVTAETNIFKEDTLWEPGHVEYAVLKISNLGTLALKYGFTINVASETGSISVATDKAFKLSDFLKYAVLEGDQSALARDKMVAAAGEGTVLNSAYAATGSMTAGAEDEVVTLVVWMPSTVGNEANYKTGAAVPQITLGISLIATQLTSESDSFDNQYDITAPWVGGLDDAGLAANTDAEAKTVKIESAEQLASFAKSVNGGNTYVGYTITLEKDIDLNNVAWTPIGCSGAAFNGTFDGQDKTIKNLNVTDDKEAGLFGYAINHGVIKNVKIDGATVVSNHYAGAVFAHGYADIMNCEVSNATVTTTPEFVGDEWDNGDKAGAVVGQICEGSYIVSGNKATNVTVTAYRDLGGIAGYTNAGVVVKDNVADNVTLVINQEHNYKGYTTDEEFDADGIVGENVTPANYSNNTATNVTYRTIIPMTATDETVVTGDNITIQNTTIQGAGANGTSGDLNVSGDNFVMKNVVFTGSDSHGIAIAVSTGADNEGTVFDNVTVTDQFRGIQFWNLSGDSVIRNSTLDIAGYPFNVDAVTAGATLTVENTTLNGWTSYTNGIELVTFTDCSFGENKYAYCRPYSTTVFDGCEFADGFQVNAGGTDAITITFTNCSYNGTAITAENIKTLGFIDTDGFNANCTVIVNGTTVNVLS